MAAPRTIEATPVNPDPIATSAATEATALAAESYSPFDKLEKQLVPGDIANTEDGFQYIYTPTRDYVGQGPALADWRLKMKARGFKPVNGPEYRGAQRPEYHVSEPSAEIWRRPAKLRDDEWRAQLAWLCLENRYFAEYHKRHPGALPWLPQALRDAIYERFNLKGDGKGEVNTPELRARIISLCRRMKVHPGPPASED